MRMHGYMTSIKKMCSLLVRQNCPSKKSSPKRYIEKGTKGLVIPYKIAKAIRKVSKNIPPETKGHRDFTLYNIINRLY